VDVVVVVWVFGIGWVVVVDGYVCEGDFEWCGY